MEIERIANFLAQGLKPSQIATIVGCTPAYISQLQKDEDFKTLVAAKAAESGPSVEDAALNGKYLAMEHKILNQLESALPFATEIRDITRALEVISNRQDRRAAMKNPALQNPSTMTVINLQMPAHAVPEVLVNQQKEVIAIGSKPLASLSSGGVTALFQTLRAEQEAKEAF